MVDRHARRSSSWMVGGKFKKKRRLILVVKRKWLANSGAFGNLEGRPSYRRSILSMETHQTRSLLKVILVTHNQTSSSLPFPISDVEIGKD